MDHRLVELVDIISDDPYITPEQVMEQMKLEPTEFWSLVDKLQTHIEAGRPLPRRRTKTTWRDVLAYG